MQSSPSPTSFVPQDAPEPLAIVGIACRFPGGADSPNRFWQLLTAAVDAISTIPPDRWDAASFYDPDSERYARMVTMRGGFLSGLDRFDAAFFGLSPREAMRMDPQQRLLMELSWEALEDTGVNIPTLSGSRMGVFVGCSGSDYLDIQLGAAGRGGIDIHTQTGSNPSIVANRLSWFYDIHGPSLVVDTACSSSLTALHLACESLRQGNCDAALVGGVGVLLRPEPTIGFSKAGMLSTDGRCKAFDSRANGYVRSEGAGLVVIKPLGAALAAGERIYAVIRATGINQDGHTNGLTVPSGAAQEQLIRDVCRQAKVTPASVQYVEAHGTGTPVGDPIEAAAIGAALGTDRPTGKSLVIGSVKTNIGHLEPASGIAGLIKLTLSLYHRQIPPNLHFETPNPAIPFEQLGLRVPTRVEPWPDCAPGQALGGVNSFGFGGANAHALLSDVPPATIQAETTASQPGTVFLPLSARSTEARLALARTYLERLTSETTLEDVCYSASVHRTHHDLRLALVGDSVEELRQRLQQFVSGTTLPEQTVSGRAGRPVFVFTGMGPQWWGMGRQLLTQEPIFRQTLERCDVLFQPLAGWSLIEELQRDETTSRLASTEFGQPAIFAIQVGLTALWRAWGVEPEAIIGHSAGEVAAFYAAGVISLQEGLRVIYYRSLLQQRAAGPGRMLAVSLPADELQPFVDGFEEDVTLAAVNGPAAIALAGNAPSLTAVAARLETAGVFHRFLRGDVAYHSPHMDPLKEDVFKHLGRTMRRPASVPLYSSVLGGVLDTRQLEPDYWWRNVREPVRFANAVKTMLDDGFRTFLEIGPHPTLGTAIQDQLTAQQLKGTVLHSLRRQADEHASLLQALGALYCLGLNPRWESLYPNGRRVDLPTYPWQRERYWQETPRSRNERLGAASHPLLRLRPDLARPVWELVVGAGQPDWLADHVIQGSIVFPAAGYLEMTIAGAFTQSTSSGILLEDVDIERGMFLTNDETRTLQLSLTPREHLFELASQPTDSEETWTPHAHGRLSTATPPASTESLNIQMLTEDANALDVSAVYSHFSSLGLEYGPAFRPIQGLWQTKDGYTLAQLALSNEIDDTWHLHPALLDGCFQSLLAGLHLTATPLPVHIRRLHFWRAPGRNAWCVAHTVRVEGREVTGDLDIYDAAGHLATRVEGLRCRLLANTTQASDASNLLYALHWQPDPARLRVAPATLQLPSEVAHSLLAPVQALEADLPATTPETHAILLPLGLAFIHQAFHELGWELLEGETFTTTALAERWQIVPGQQRFFQRLLEILAEEHVLHQQGDSWRMLRTPNLPDLESLLAQARAACPAARVDIEIVERCGRACARVLRGEHDPLELLFPRGDSDFAARLYSVSGNFLRYNRAAAEAVRLLAAHWTSSRPIRVLEVGGGSGGMTAGLLDVLPPERRQYVFTDVSDSLLKQTALRFAGEHGIEYRRFDLERNPSAQGLPEGSFDLIVASDVLHATQDLGISLDHCRRLLTPGGWLLALEVTRPACYMDLVFGTLPGWWRFTDVERRAHSALIPFADWEKLVCEHGFATVTALPEPFGVAGEGPHTLWLAQADQAEPALPMKPDSWLVFNTPGEVVGAQIVDVLRSGGASVWEAQPDPIAGALPIAAEAPGAFEKLLQHPALVAAGNLQVVFLWPLAGGDEPVSTTLAESALSLIQALSTRTISNLWLVTQAATEAGPDAAPQHLSHAPIWGLGRVAATELPDLHCRLVDLPQSADAADLLLEELLRPDAENESAWRNGQRYTPRLVRENLDTPHVRQRLLTPSLAESVRLVSEHPGHLEGLALEAFHPAAPQKDEVQIEVQAAGLNFKDVMKAMGLLSDSVLAGGFSGWALGMECTGRISAVGPGVENWRVGDEVVALARNAFAGVVNCSVDLVARKPSQWTFEQAAGLPVAFLTAWYGLVHLARLEAGERILIHAAAGGVGLAALQIARLLRAEVLTTAGSDAKRRWLLAQGAAQVFDSRSTSFAEDVLRHTDGRGVDVILNSLAGEAMQRSLSLLAPFGRFIELGKQDIDQNAQIGLRRFQDNQAYFAVDIDRLLRERQPVGGRLLRELAAEAEAGRLTPLPTRSFSFSKAQDAFRHMARGKHIGKIALTTPANNGEALRVREAARPAFHIHADATYLVTGGTSGLGLESAAWLVEQGARHLVLASRNGLATPEVQSRVEALRAIGATVHAPQIDISQRTQVESLLAEIAAAGPPLRGIIHAAMILSDSLLTGLTPERLRAVFAPKTAGAWHLHTATLGQELDFFVMYSSVANYVGNRGQANYVAANAFLEALAHHRRGQGLAALTVNWGRLSETGFVARNAAVAASLEAQGFLPLAPAQALSVLGKLLHHDATQIGVLGMDWARWKNAHPALATSPRYAGVLDDLASSAGPGHGNALARKLQHLTQAERTLEVERLILEKLGAILGGTLPADRPLTTIGLDSLMAVELSSALETALGLSVPVTRLLQGPTAAQLAGQLAGQLASNDPAPTVVAPLSPAVTPSVSTVVPLRPAQEDGDGLSIFCVHAIEGTIECFKDLVKHIPPSIGLYALQAPDNLNGTPPFETVEARAAHYAHELLLASAGRPYLLLGYSFGGALALEMTRQLEKDGHAPQRLILLDAPAPSTPGTPPPSAAETRAWIEETLLALGERLAPNAAEREQALLSALQRAGLPASALDLERIIGLMSQRAEALLRYRPQAVAVPTLLLRAAVRPPGAFRIFPGASAPDFGWQAHLPSITIVETPGDHNTVLIRRNLAALVKRILS